MPTRHAFAALSFFALVTFSFPAHAAAQTPAASRAIRAVVQQPLRFEALDARGDGQPGFLSRGHGYAMALTAGSAVVSLRSDRGRSSVVRITWPGADASVLPVGSEPAAGLSNYLIGSDPARWRRGVAAFSKVRYASLYPKIDLQFYGNREQLEYDFIVAPGGDPRDIRLRFSGENAIRIDGHGNLVIRAGAAEVVQRAPVVYQEHEGKREAVAGRYIRTNRHEVGFAVADYDRASTLYIDPILTYASFFGGNALNYAKGVAVDSAGNAYVTGYTNATNFPTTSGAYLTTCATCAYNKDDVFVTKISSTGTLIYSTYVGGSDYTDDKGYAIAVDSAGNAYVTGETYYSGSGAGFPVVNGFTQTVGGGGFFFKLNSTGTNLLYSTQIRSGSSAAGYGVAVEGSNAYVVGEAVAGNSFPLWPTAGTYSQYIGPQAGTYQAFILKIDTTLSGLPSLVYADRIGGWDSNYAYAVAVNSAGEAYVAGNTTSYNFPTTTGAAQTGCGSDGNCNSRVADAFVLKMNAAGSALVYSTFAGGSGTDTAYGIALDAAGNAYVTGVTSSSDFPATQGAYDTSCGANGTCDTSSDAFVFKLSSTGASFLYSTYVGGGSADTGRAIAVDSAGNAYVGGDTASSNFPVTLDAIQPARNGTNGDAFVSVLNSTGSALLYSSYLGGSGNVSGGDKIFGVALDSIADLWVVGQTDSSNFPVKPNAISATHDTGTFDGFVVKIGEAQSVTSVLPTAGGTAGGTPLTINGTGFMSGAAVTVGGVAATGVSAVSSTKITAVTPAHATGAVDVVVTSLDGQVGTLAGAFTYVAPLTFTDDPLQAGLTTIKAVHIAELESAVNTLRNRYGLGSVAWYGVATPGALVYAMQLTGLRTALEEVYTAAGLTVPTWHPATITSGSTIITAAQITELRTAARAVW